MSLVNKNGDMAYTLGARFERGNNSKLFESGRHDFTRRREGKQIETDLLGVMVREKKDNQSWEEEGSDTKKKHTKDTT